MRVARARCAARVRAVARRRAHACHTHKRVLCFDRRVRARALLFIAPTVNENNDMRQDAPANVATPAAAAAAADDDESDDDDDTPVEKPSVYRTVPATVNREVKDDASYQTFQGMRVELCEAQTHMLTKLNEQWRTQVRRASASTRTHAHMHASRTQAAALTAQRHAVPVELPPPPPPPEIRAKVRIFVLIACIY